MKLDRKYLPVIIVALIVMLLFVGKVPYAMVGQNTAGNAGTCSFSGNQMTCTASNPSIGTANIAQSTTITIQGAASYAQQKGLTYNKCKVISASVTVYKDTGGSYFLTPTDLNTPYDATGDSCPISFSSGIQDPAIDSQASFSATVIYYLAASTCTDIPVKPCDQAIWQDYPTCQWSTADCNNPPNNNILYILAGAIGLLSVGEYLLWRKGK